MTRESPLPDSGSLGDTALPRLLLSLREERLSGALALDRARSRVRILLHDGAAVALESNLSGGGLAAQLRDAGRITATQHQAVLALAKRKHCEEGAALLALGWCSAAELFPALREQLRRRVLACFAWADGHYRIDRDAAPPAEAQPMRCDTYALVHQGLSTHWSADRLLADLSARLDQFPRRTPRFAGIQPKLPETAAVQALCADIDGRRPLGALLAAGAGSPELLATAWLLDASGALRYSDCAAAPAPIDSPGLDIQIEVREAPAAAAAARASGARAGTPPPATDSRGDVEVLRAEILDRYARRAELDHYALLGVEADARPVAIKKAYFRAAKRYHPDALRRLALTAVEEQAAQIFSSLGEAYEVLSDPAKRSEYDRLLAHGPDADTDSLVRAETFFRKAEILLRGGDFRGALPYLEAAVEAWPEEAEYQSSLGWALYKKTPPEPERAQTHLERALELDPAHAESRMRLDLVRRDLTRN